MNILKLEAGKIYCTREGSKAKIYEVFDKGPYYINGAVFKDGIWSVFRWNNLGKCSYHDPKPDFDIVSEWEYNIENIDFDASCLPKWAKWINMDDGKKWMWHESIPRLYTNSYGMKKWEFDNYRSGVIPTEHNPRDFHGDWKDSLFEVKR